MSSKDELIDMILVASGCREASANRREKAALHCQTFKESQKVWRKCLGLLVQGLGASILQEAGNSTNHAQVVNFLLNVVLSGIRREYRDLSEGERKHTRAALMQLAGQMSKPNSNRSSSSNEMPPSLLYPPFLRNKIAVVLVAVLQVDYPERWPDFFKVILSSLKEGASRVDMFLRILDAVDNDIVGYDEKRTKSEVYQINKIKHHMQDTCINEIMSALMAMTKGLKANHKPLAKKAMELIKEYTTWIKLELVTSQKFLEFVFGIIRSDQSLRSIGLDILNEVIRKKTDFAQKVLILQKSTILNLLDAQIYEVVKILSVSKDAVAMANELNQNEFLESLAAAVDSAVVQALGCIESLVAQKRHAQLLGEAIPPDVDKAVSVGFQTVVRAMLQALKILEIPLWKVANELKGALDAFIGFAAKVKNNEIVNCPRELCDGKALLKIADRILERCEFPREYDHENSDVEEANFDEYRRAIEYTFVNLVRNFGNIVLPHLFQNIAKIVRDAKHVRPSLIEAGLRLLYRVYEGAPNKQKDQLTKSGMIPKIMALVIDSRISTHPDVALSLVYVELVSRYSGFLANSPQYLEDVLLSFLDRRGMEHKNAQVRSRSCYLFLRLLRALSNTALRKRVGAMSPKLLEALQTKIVPFFKRGLYTGAMAQTSLQINDVQFLTEALGLLCSSSYAGKSGNQAAFSLCCKTLHSNLLLLASMTSECRRDPQLAGDRISDIVNMMGSLTKFVTRDAKHFKEPLAECLKAIQKVLLILPAHKRVRSTTIFFLHRMVTCLRSTVTPYLKHTLLTLIKHTRGDSLRAVSELVNQIVVQSRQESISLVSFIFTEYMELYRKVLQTFSFIDEKTANSAYASHIQDRDEIFQCYYGFLMHILAKDEVFYTAISNIERNKVAFQHTLRTLLEGCSQRNMRFVKFCLETVGGLTSWGSKLIRNGNSQSAMNSNQLKCLRNLLSEGVTQATVNAVTNRHMMPDDAKAASGILAIVEIHKTLKDTFGVDFLKFLQQQMVRAMPSSQQMISEYLSRVNSNHESFGLRNILRDIIRSHLAQSKE